MSINSQILAIKQQAEQLNGIGSIIVEDLPNQTGNLVYPLVRIWSAGVDLNTDPNNSSRVNNYVIAVVDRYTKSINAISDTADILLDLISKLRYVEDGNINWTVNSRLDVVGEDAEPDEVAGHIVTVQAREVYKRDVYCDPSGLCPTVFFQRLLVIDSGGADADYCGTLIIEGGSA